MKRNCIMIMGTASSVGKSLISAGLCRVLKQDGYSVAPFKSQNMSLNSFITKENGEMGRAQVVQAEAAGIEPSVLMNPVLLKPTCDTKAQVIIKGKVHGNMSAVEYDNFKPQLKSIIKGAFDELQKSYDIIVVEGAGSPAEINLKENDIVNMGMAEMVDAPVILVGDIDKGGVFASLAGTMLLLDEKEKARIKGVIINKFRGDIEILRPGLKMLEDIIHVPVLGVVPYSRIDIDDEDGFMAERVDNASLRNEAAVEIVVVKLPHISNFTDFNIFESVKGCQLRYIESAHELNKPDLIIIPGTKNTIGDLLYMRKSGIEQRIIDLHDKGVPIFGVCGGYQMLGLEIYDPLGVETGLKMIDGMGLLEAKTVFREEKITTRVEAVITCDEGLLKGSDEIVVEGYEIHMGETSYSEECIPFIKTRKISGQDAEEGAGITDINKKVFGTYIHGIFDNIKLANCIVNNLRNQKGLKPHTSEDFDYKQHKNGQYDKLAEILRQSLDMNKIHEILS